MAYKVGYQLFLITQTIVTASSNHKQFPASDLPGVWLSVSDSLCKIFFINTANQIPSYGYTRICMWLYVNRQYIYLNLYF